MNNLVKFVVRDAVTRETRRWGECPPDMFDMQAAAGEIVEKWTGGEMAEPLPVSAQIQARELAILARRKRDHLLRLSDFSQLPDAPILSRLAWVAYRRALRDLPQQPGFPEKIDWPQMPGGGA